MCDIVTLRFVSYNTNNKNGHSKILILLLQPRKSISQFLKELPIKHFNFVEFYSHDG